MLAGFSRFISIPALLDRLRPELDACGSKPFVLPVQLYDHQARWRETLVDWDAELQDGCL